ncbi:MAG: cell division ATP-binding protein FtsE [Lachnospiraceae bacterium]|nr:cell division ATP-binding protein FtsE [Lachnospiraceae bacterium]
MSEEQKTAADLIAEAVNAADTAADTAENAAYAAEGIQVLVPDIKVDAAKTTADDAAEAVDTAAVDAAATVQGEVTEEEPETQAAPVPEFVKVAQQAKAQKAAREAEAAARAAQEEEVDDLPQYDEEELPPPPSGEGPVIVFDHVTKEYTDGPDDADAALKDVSFSIDRGEFVFIVGPSGSGKSTLIRLLMREISPTSGSVFIAGTDLSGLRNRQVCKYRRSIGIVFQDFRLLEDRTVFENIAFAQKVIGVPSRKITKNVSKMLSMVRLRNKYRSYPNKLSGGEQQRVAVARALINNPLILLADEPTGNLDPKNTIDIMELLEDINARGTTVVVVTHNHEIVDNMQKRVISLRDGVIVDDKKGGYDRG